MHSAALSARFISAGHYPQPFTMLFFDIPRVGHSAFARMLSRILRGFLEREANVKQTHGFR
jgi:hypothetical protein